MNQILIYSLSIIALEGETEILLQNIILNLLPHHYTTRQRKEILFLGAEQQSVHLCALTSHVIPMLNQFSTTNLKREVPEPGATFFKRVRR